MAPTAPGGMVAGAETCRLRPIRLAAAGLNPPKRRMTCAYGDTLGISVRSAAVQSTLVLHVAENHPTVYRRTLDCGTFVLCTSSISRHPLPPLTPPTSTAMGVSPAFFPHASGFLGCMLRFPGGLGYCNPTRTSAPWQDYVDAPGIRSPYPTLSRTWRHRAFKPDAPSVPLCCVAGPLSKGMKRRVACAPWRRLPYTAALAQRAAL
jgi:hypothetical protein